jgi:hypothetical protein
MQRNECTSASIGNDNEGRPLGMIKIRNHGDYHYRLVDEIV